MDDIEIGTLVNTIYYSSCDSLRSKAESKLYTMAENDNPIALLEMGELMLRRHSTTGSILESYFNPGLELRNYEFGLDLLVRAHHHGNKEAITRWGIHLKNMGDFNNAVRYFKLSIEENNCSRAMTNLGSCYLTGTGVPSDYLKAISLFKQASDLKDYEAMYLIGECYSKGYGVEIESIKEIQWMSKAAKAGSIDACLRLGELYYTGSTVEKDIKESNKWYLNAIEYYKNGVKLGNVPSIIPIAEIYSEKLGDIDSAVSWYKKGIELGSDYAIAPLYNIYKYKNNDENILKWLEEASENGSTNILRLLGSHYKEQNEPKKSIKWYTKLSEREGSKIEGTISLAKIYEEIEEYNMAIKYYNDLAHLDVYAEEVNVAVGKIYEKIGKYEKARERYMEHVYMNSGASMIAIGDMYINGHGVEKDLDKALEWYKNAVQSDSWLYLEKLHELEVFKVIAENPGILVTDINLEYDSDEERSISEILDDLELENKVSRIKIGNTNKLYVT